MLTSGYCDRLDRFVKTEPVEIIKSLKEFVKDAGDSQIRAWYDSIKILRTEIQKLIDHCPLLDEKCSIILEYNIPLESRRIDAVVLLNGAVIVIEFKGKSTPTHSDIDQAAAYARDLRAYHKECAAIPVKCVLTLTRVSGLRKNERYIEIISPEYLSTYCIENLESKNLPVDLNRFLSMDSYQPLPSLIKAARELFRSGSIKRIHRAACATEPTLKECSKIIRHTAEKKRRALILICGVPGAGKTLVGLQLAHANYLDDLSIARRNGDKPTAPAVFLSGNGPLVEVLQYELRSAGGDGKAFVRGVHEYVKTFTKSANIVPPQHVLIYDEAQRAFDAGQVQAKHPDMPEGFQGLSEPELFIRFAERVPEWCVVVGLIGPGQEIHIGEEGGLGQWKTAIEKAIAPGDWDIYIPDNDEVKEHFKGSTGIASNVALELKSTIRFHLAVQLCDFVKSLLEGQIEKAQRLGVELEKSGYSLRLTHDLEKAKTYLVERYQKSPHARYGMVASAKDKDLIKHGIPKGFKNPGEVGPGKYGKWYSEPIGERGSCTNLDTVVTEFGAQGLELDACLLAWGTDFIKENGSWTNKFASGYKEANRVVNAKALRLNSYRVLLTRGRDGCVVFVPPIPDKMRETYKFLMDCGFSELREDISV